MVQHSSARLCVVYQAAPGMGRSCSFHSCQKDEAERPERTLGINVVSPSFYSRFVHYAGVDEAFNREFLCTDSKNQTVSLLNAHLLPRLLPTKHNKTQADHSSDRTRGWGAAIRWNLLRKLRCPPPGKAYPDPVRELSNLLSRKDVQPQNFSSMDNFIMRRGDDEAVYKRAVTKLFIAQRFFYGLTPLVTGVDYIIRLCLSSCALTTILAVKQKDLSMTGGAQFVIGSCAIHLWALLKCG